MKAKLLGVALTWSIMASAISCYADIPQTEISGSSKELLQQLIIRTKACVAASQDINVKEDVLSLLDALQEKRVILEEGSDDLRVKFVQAQGVIEQALSSALALGEIDQIIGVIHTPQPATPFCTEVANLDDQLLDSSIRQDSDKLLTVRSRAVILRDYLDKGGKLYIAYPQGGLEKRSPAQQAVYQKELARYPENLIDTVLSCSIMEADKVGATYLVKNKHDDIVVFSIKARQANDPTENSEWGLWFGSLQDPIIKKRVDEIFDYLISNNGQF